MEALFKSKKPKRIMGVDCSTYSFAYSIFEGGKAVICGEIWFEGKTLYERIASAQKLVQAAIDDGTLVADAVAMEAAIQVGGNRQTGLHLAYVYGAVVAVLVNAGMKMQLVAPTTWMPYFGYKKMTKVQKADLQLLHPGKSASWYKEEERRLRKQQIMEIAKQYFKTEELVTDNISDSVGINVWALKFYDTIG